MRISTSLLYQLGVQSIGGSEADLVRTQQQIGSGRRMLTPSDDPVAAAQALSTRGTSAQNDRYAANIASAKDALDLNESVMARITDVLQNARTSAVDAGNGALSDADRRSIAADIASRLDELVGLANSSDGSGGYLYSGYQPSTAPFAQTTTGVAYNGDQGQRSLEIAPSRTIPVSVNGSALFEQVRAGNGTFTVTPGANTGSGVMGSTSVVDPAALTGHSYRLQFNTSAGTTTYDVVDTTTSTTVSSANAYSDGSSITVAGMQVKLTGVPATGDTFTLAPSGMQSIFQTLSNLVTALNKPSASAGANATFGNAISGALTGIDGALEHVLTARADVGAHLRELDALASGSDDRKLQYQSTLSRLENLDYNAALSHFAQQQVALEAAQKSFAQISGLSLFRYL